MLICLRSMGDLKPGSARQRWQVGAGGRKGERKLVRGRRPQKQERNPPRFNNCAQVRRKLSGIHLLDGSIRNQLIPCRCF
ncbi:hypothetical protein OJAV_G00079700 [Oryzias javanicus]|uniref:Uncharacterized protein n=1 Tax=Oryzias javanicus TaxID=123683 RepID=A0A3S2MLM6_ORYJA|nr:hypothetical protein OJAV_G00079700 [Oryzias javanicus]